MRGYFFYVAWPALTPSAQRFHYVVKCGFHCRSR
jgi:hypothetical protein